MPLSDPGTQMGLHTGKKKEKHVSIKQSIDCVIDIEAIAQTRSAVNAFTPVEL